MKDSGGGAHGTLWTRGRNSGRWWTDSQFPGLFDYEEGLLIPNVKNGDNAPQIIISTLNLSRRVIFDVSIVQGRDTFHIAAHGILQTISKSTPMGSSPRGTSAASSTSIM